MFGWYKMGLIGNRKGNSEKRKTNKEDKLHIKGKKQNGTASNYVKFKLQKRVCAGLALPCGKWTLPLLVVSLTFFSAHFDRHGFLLAWGISGSNGDQVRCTRLEVSQQCGVLCLVYRCGAELAPGQGRVFNVVTCDRLRLKRAPAEANAGCSRFSNCYHGWAQHLWS